MLLPGNTKKRKKAGTVEDSRGCWMIRYCSTKSPLNESNYLCSRWVYDRFVEALAACAAQFWLARVPAAP